MKDKIKERQRKNDEFANGQTWTKPEEWTGELQDERANEKHKRKEEQEKPCQCDCVQKSVAETVPVPS